MANHDLSTTGRELHDSSEQGDYDNIENDQTRAEVRSEAVRVLEEMEQLKTKLPSEFGYDGANFSLQTYWVALKIYANSLVIGTDANGVGTEDAAYLGGKPLFEAYVGDTPDSAIGVTDGTGSLKSLDQVSTRSPGTAEQYIQEVTDLMDEMMDVPSRPPTPPPKDVKRLENLRRGMVSPFVPLPTTPEDSYGVVTEITSEGRSLSSSASRTPAKSGRVGRMLGHWRNALSESSPPSVSSKADTLRPSTPVMQASLVRRGSRRLSTSIKRLPLWNTELLEPEGPGSPGSNAVFGVSVAKSMLAARSVAKTHHTGNGSSRRDFPLCMHKCAVFLRKEGLEAPDIFAEPGDSYRVQKLKEAFSKAPSYGEDVNWDNYGVYDAADIVLLFLSQLPRPLIPEPVAKRWISLSRQATISGSHSTRLDQCIDFWEEAMGGLRGHQRDLFKLLLNLWAEIADAAEKNDMTAERLAGVILKPLMHTSSEKFSTDYMLGLAFLIRKRSEYTLMLTEGRQSRAAFD